MTTVSAVRLIGKRLVDLLVSTKPLVGEGLPGLPRPCYYDVVLQFDDGARITLMGDQLEVWSGRGKLAPIDPRTFGIDPNVAIAGQMVTKVSADDVGDLVLEFENHTRLQVVTEHGTRIVVSAAPIR